MLPFPFLDDLASPCPRLDDFPLPKLGAFEGLGALDKVGYSVVVVVLLLPDLPWLLRLDLETELGAADCVGYV